MKRLIAALSFVALAACTPPAGGAEGVVRDIYAAAQRDIGGASAPELPMSDDLKALIDRGEAAADARGEPFIEGDIALDCQDCTSISDLVIGPQTGAEQEPTRAGHQWVQASFKLNGNEDRTVLWDMVETPHGWRVDDIFTRGSSLRAEAQSYIDTPAATPVPAGP